MSYEALTAVEDCRAWEPTRRFEEMYLFHVPFDEVNGDDRTEATVARMTGRGARLAILGESGSGKSSLISYVFGPLATHVPDYVVPLRIPVAAADDDVVMDPGKMAQYIVRYVTRWASRELFTEEQVREFEEGVADRTRRFGKASSRQFHLGLPVWLAKAEFASQLQASGNEYEVQGMGMDAVEQLKSMAALFDSNGLYPVFVFDDSDTWLKIPGLDRSHVANSFFLRTVRMIAKDIEAGLVMAVHEQYAELEGYKEARGWYTGEVRVPRLIDAREGLGRILWDGIVVADANVPASLDEVVEADAVGYLAKFYESGRSLRDVLRISQRGLQNALSDKAELITRPLVEQAASELDH